MDASLPCPACGNDLRKVWPGVAPNMLCNRCGACWERRPQGLSRLDPVTCKGCASRRVCQAALAERSP